ncbi:MAG: lactate racemase domain-containing protein [Candidatus Methylomirabilales bacterium]
MALPLLARVTQQFDRTRLADPSGAVAAGLRATLAGKLRPGAQVAITAGSRGIQNLVAMTRAAVDTVKALGAEPFIVPAMGSHGGATGEGQKALLADLGISEASMGCPVRSSVAVEEIGRTPGGVPVYLDRHALHADGIIAINRVKLHTIFRGDVESGLCKILAVGLGKHKGAQQIHKIGVASIVVESARVILAKAPVIAGVAVLENSLDETMEVHVVPPAAFEATDVALLKRCWRLLPRVPFDPLDVLVVDEMGKNISGTGMDTNVIGVGGRVGGKMMPGTPFVSTVVALGLTAETHGNANGIGLADLTTRRLVNSIDYKSTYTNVITTRLWAGGRLPLVFETDREAIQVAVGDTPLSELRFVRIPNTLHLEALEISEALLPEAEKLGLPVVRPPRPLEFDADGRIRPF